MSDSDKDAQIRIRANKVHTESIVNMISTCEICMGPVGKQCAESKFRYVPFLNKQNRIKNCRRRAMHINQPSDHFDCNICGQA